MTDQQRRASTAPQTAMLPRAPAPVPHHPASYQSRQQRTSIDNSRVSSMSTTSPLHSPISTDEELEPDLSPPPAPVPVEAPPTNEALPSSGARPRRQSRPQDDTSLQDSEPLQPPPMVPDAPRAPPPVSYRDPQINGNGVARASSASTRTSAARGKSNAVDPKESRVPANRNQPAPSGRTTGLEQPVARLSAQHRVQPARAEEPLPRLDTSGAVPPQRNTSVRRKADPDLSSDPQSQPRRRSDAQTSSAQQRREWAPDRSPLQKLELTLQDITKEERRAQVEEAELIAREAKAGRGGRKLVRKDQTPSQTQPQPQSRSINESQRAPDPLAEAGLVRSLSSKQKDRIQRTATVESRKPNESRRLSSANDGPAFEYQEQQYRQKPPPTAQGTGAPGRRDGTRDGTARPRAAPEEGNLDPPIDQRWQSQGAPLNRRGPPSSRAGGQGARELPRAQEMLYAERLNRSQRAKGPVENEPSSYPDSRGAAARGGTRGGYDDYDDHDHDGYDDDYDQRPRTANGRDPGFGPTPLRRRLTDFLPHRKRDSTKIRFDNADLPRQKRLDHWKTAQTARVAVAELPEVQPNPKQSQVDKDRAWWEANGANSARRSGMSASNAPRDSTLTSDEATMPAEEGTTISTSSNRVVLPVYPRDIERRNNVSAPRARQYLTQPKISRHRSRVRRRIRPWLRLHGLGHVQPGRRLLVPDHLSPYSYSCPQLSKHDIFHPFHVCPPIEDRELIRSMRSVRIRTVADPTTFSPPLYLKCGPLLRYLGIHAEPSSSSADGVGREVWRGSVMIVTTDSDSSYEVVPTLRLFSQPMDLLPPPPAQVEELPPEYVDPLAGLPIFSRTGQTLYVKPVDHLEEERDVSRLETDEGLFEEKRSSLYPTGDSYGDGAADGRRPSHGNGRILEDDGEKLGMFQEVQGIRLHAERGVTFWRFNIEVELGERQSRVAYRINRGPAIGFWVPAVGDTMNVMFHTCNGFSLTVNPDLFSGPDPLWRDVLNTHQTRPFHVMIGGGDQIYNDAIMKQSTLFQDWLSIKNPTHKRSAPFSKEMLQELETFYLERYSMWFSQGLFGMANSQIPMVNIWDDHDIVDGYGSYPDQFMSTPVFMGLGSVAFKYYMLFQHQSVPDEMETDEPSWILGADPGPYINELSRSVFVSLGRKVAFLGLDCRTERMREEVISERTYDRIFDRCKKEILRGETKHLIVLLGIPIAYPRLVWLENILTSRVMDPVKAVGRSGALGGLLNKFDGGVEILDDLDDHWTASNHKVERNWFIQELQELAAGKSVRVTILGGDVHMAAIGQFYSNPRLGIPKDRDHRYMPNVISSAIVNTPPPEMMGDILNKRNKIHHLDQNTDEDMIPMFTHDVDGKPRNNKRLLPRRNWCSIREYHPGGTPPLTPTTPEAEPASPQTPQLPPIKLTRTLSLSRRDMNPGNLFRRLSNRGGPPRVPSSNGSGSISAGAFPRPSSSTADGYFPPQNAQNNNSNGNGNGNGRPERPTLFHHKTSDAMEGKPRALQAHAGASHINLEGGLDIVLNAEVSQKDPAGITMPYRLLVPALWAEPPPQPQGADDEYDDREEPRPPGLQRRLTDWTRRLSMRGPQKEYYSDEEGDEEWGARDEDPRRAAPPPRDQQYAPPVREQDYAAPERPAPRQRNHVPPQRERNSVQPSVERNYAPPAAPAGERNYAPPAAPAGERNYAPPAGERNYAPPAAPAGERNYAPPAAPAGERNYAPPAGERNYAPPAAPAGERNYAPPAGERNYTPPAAPAGERNYAPPAAPAGERNYAPPADERNYAPPAAPAGERNYAPPAAPAGERNYAPPAGERNYAPPAGERNYAPPAGERNYAPPAGERNYAPPAGERNYAPPAGERSSAPPRSDRNSAPPPRQRGYGAPPRERDYGAPPRERDYGEPPWDDEHAPPPRDYDDDMPENGARRGGAWPDKRQRVLGSRDGPPPRKEGLAKKLQRRLSDATQQFSQQGRY